jgi:transcription initiation factor TFIIB
MYSNQEEYACKNCKKQTRAVMDVAEGKVTCTSCGLTLEERCIDPTPEWRNFADGNSSGADPRRIGGAINTFLEDGGLSLDIRGSMANESTRNLIKWNNRIQNSEDRSLIRGIQKLKEWGGLMSLQGIIINKAEEQFSKLENNRKSLKGRNVESLAAAILFIASRQCKCPLKPIEISNATHVDIKDLRNAYKFVKQYIDYVPHMEPTKYGHNFASKLNLPSEIVNASTEVINRIMKKGLIDGRNPRTIASAAIYMVTQLTPDHKRSLREISSVSNIAENTIKTSYKDIYANRYEIVPDWKARLPVESLNQ